MGWLGCALWLGTATAGSGASVSLPPDESFENWRPALTMAGLEEGPGGVAIAAEGATWRLSVRTRTGERSAVVAAPTDARGREAVAIVAASLLRAGPAFDAPLPAAATAETEAASAETRVEASGPARPAEATTAGPKPGAPALTKRSAPAKAAAATPPTAPTTPTASAAASAAAEARATPSPASATAAPSSPWETTSTPAKAPGSVAAPTPADATATAGAATATAPAASAARAASTAPTSPTAPSPAGPPPPDLRLSARLGGGLTLREGFDATPGGDVELRGAVGPGWIAAFGGLDAPLELAEGLAQLQLTRLGGAGGVSFEPSPGWALRIGAGGWMEAWAVADVNSAEVQTGGAVLAVFGTERRLDAGPPRPLGLALDLSATVGTDLQGIVFHGGGASPSRVWVDLSLGIRVGR